MLIEHNSDFSFFDKKDLKITVRIINQLKPGDIAFKHPESFSGPVIIDHCLLCTGYNNETEIYEFIEAHFHHGVQYRFEKKENLTGLQWGPFVRVYTANDKQIQNAIDFARRQIGKDFQIEWINKNYNPSDIKNDSLANKWYCSELIWAAYYNCNNEFPENTDECSYVYGQGIDIDLNGWKQFLGRAVVTPREIMYDFDVIRLLLIENQIKTKLPIS
jgi:hypothetical protein